MTPMVESQSDRTTTMVDFDAWEEAKRRARLEREVVRIQYLAMWSSGKWAEVDEELRICRLALFSKEVK